MATPTLFEAPKQPPYEPPNDEAGLRFGLLGPFEVRAQGQEVRLSGRKVRALLAMLVVHANETVSVDRLIDGLWGAEPPSTAQQMVQIHVSRIRRALDAIASPGILETRDRGYRLRAPHGQVDVPQFEELVARARSVAQDPVAASRLYAEALALWRGPALADMLEEPFAPAVASRLDDLRSAAVQERIDADLSRGRSTELVGELRQLTFAEPYHERFAGQLMLALYRSGRQAEALEVFHDIRDRLSNDLGIEPGQELQRLQAAILRQDHSIETRPLGQPVLSASAVEQSAAPAGADLRSAPSPKVGLVLRVAIGFTAIVGVALGVGRTDTGGGAAVHVTPNSVVSIDAATMAVTHDIAVGNLPGAIAADGSTVWVANSQDHTVTRLDADTFTAGREFGLPEPPLDLAASSGILWIGNGFSGTVSRIIRKYDELSAPFYPGPTIEGFTALAADPAAGWAGLSDGTLVELDAGSLQTLGKVTLPQRSHSILVEPSAIWSVDLRGDSVTEVDPTRMQVVHTRTLQGAPQAAAYGLGEVWVATTQTDGISELDPRTGAIVAERPLDVSPTAIAVSDKSLWVLSGRSGTIERIDPGASGVTTRIELNRTLGGIAVVGQAIWVTVD